MPDRCTKRCLLLRLLLVAVVFLVYAPSVDGPLIFDDYDTIQINETIRSIPASLSPPPESTMTSRPVVNFTFALNFALHGQNPAGYRWVNIALHAGAALLLWSLVAALAARPIIAAPIRAWAPWLGGAAALLWAVHPVATEAVVYVTQRTELLMAVFYLATLRLAAAGFERDQGETDARRWYVAAMLTCALGMASKEVMVSAPLLVLLVDGVFFSRGFGGALRSRWGFYAALAATWLVLPLVAGPRAESVGWGYGISSLDYLRTQAEVISWYQVISLWPHRLTAIYGWPIAHDWAGVWPWFLLQAALVAAVGWAILRRSWLGVAGSGFYLLLAPSSSVLPIVTEIAAERRMYLPLACVVVLGVAALTWLISRAQATTRQRAAVAAVLLAVSAGALAAGSWQRLGDYQSELRLWRSAVRAWPADDRARVKLGLALAQADRLAEAAEQFAAAVEVRPDNAKAWGLLGRAMADLGQLDAGIAHLSRASQMQPDEDLHRPHLADALARAGRLGEAAAVLEAHLGRYPESFAQWRQLGLLRARMGAYAAAAQALGRAHELEPVDVTTLDRLAFILAAAPDPAVRDAERAAALARQAAQLTDHRQPVTLDTLAMALAAQGRFDEAQRLAERARALAEAAGAERLAQDIAQRAALYAQRRAFVLPLK